MVDFGRKGLVFGSQAIAKGIERVAIEVDAMMGRIGKPHARPSTYINIGGGLALALVPNYMRAREAVKNIGEIAGFHMVNKIWDYAEEYMAPAPAAARAAAAQAAAGGRFAVETPGGAPEFYPPLYGRRTSPEPVLRNHVRYSLSNE